jgi:hypothetical protein
MYKTLPIIALVVSVVAVATLIPLTSQAFLGPIWTPFSGGCYSGCGSGGYYGGYGYTGGYGGYGYAWPYGYGRHHKYKGARFGCRYY